MSIKRFDPVIDGPLSSTYATMQEDISGDWVSYDDFDNIFQSQIEIINILKEENAKMRLKLEEINSLSGDGCQTLHDIKYRN